jgi:Ca-activated chloride channel family protein
MTFAWPWMLLSLAALPLLVLVYRRLMRRRAERRAELAEQGLVAVGAGRRARRVGPILVLTAFALLAIALARPQATVAEPRREGTVILAFDVSTSMAAKDMQPNRMEAAKKAAREFARRQPSSISVGVAAFGDNGLVTQRPTNSAADVVAAIDRLNPQGGTSVGRGILSSLSAIAGKPLTADSTDIGYYGSAAIVLLTDGEDTGGPDPKEAADLASVAGVRVYPVGLGSPEGTVLDIDGFSIATALDEALLRDIAETTDGTYYAAADEAKLAEVYDSIDLKFTTRARSQEVTNLFAAGAAVLLLAGAGSSLLRDGRVV